MNATVRIIVSINISALPSPRPFNIIQAVDAGIADLHDSQDEDETTKDLVIEWPCAKLPYRKFLREYAAPLLAAGANLQVVVENDQARAGMNDDPSPRAWVHVNLDKLESEAQAKLTAVRKALDG
jgi:hypothetical protein